METLEAQRRLRSNGLCECLLGALALYSLAPSNACAGDQPKFADAGRSAGVQNAVRAQIAAASWPARFAFAAPPQTPAFSPSDFRARKPGLLEAAPAPSGDSVIDAPMLGDTSIARELSEAKTQDRVRLLTLWRSRASSLSLQAGKRGAPSLQWSTPWMHRENASRGIFDRLLTSAHGLGAAGRGVGSRQAGPMAPAKPLDRAAPLDTR